MIGMSDVTLEIVSAKDIGEAIVGVEVGVRAREEEEEAMAAASEAAKAARRSK